MFYFLVCLWLNMGLKFYMEIFLKHIPEDQCMFVCVFVYVCVSVCVYVCVCVCVWLRGQVISDQGQSRPSKLGGCLGRGDSCPGLGTPLLWGPLPSPVQLPSPMGTGRILSSSLKNTCTWDFCSHFDLGLTVSYGVSEKVPIQVLSHSTEEQLKESLHPHFNHVHL